MKLKKTKYAFMALLIASSIGLSACGQNEEAKDTAKTEQSETKTAEVQAMKGDELAKIEADKRKKKTIL